MACTCASRLAMVPPGRCGIDSAGAIGGSPSATIPTCRWPRLVSKRGRLACRSTSSGTPSHCGAPCRPSSVNGLLCEDWYRSEIVGRGLKHPDVPRRYLDKYLLPKLRRVTAAEVTPAHITRLLDDVKHRAPTTANDLLRFARRIFSFGVRRQVVPINPIAEFSPRLDAGGPEKSRSRALSHAELIKLFESIRETESFGGDKPARRQIAARACVFARANCSARAGLSLISRVTSDPARSGICRPRAPRRVKIWIFLWCRRWSSGFRLSK